MANKSSTVKINFQFDEKALKNVTGLLKNLTIVMGGLQKKTIATNRSLDAMARKLAKLENSPLIKKGIAGGLFKPSTPAPAPSKPKLAGQSSPTYFPGETNNTLINSISGYGDNAPKVRKEQAKSNAAKEKAEAKTQKDKKKKQDSDEMKAQLAGIKTIAAISLAFEVLKTTIKFAVDAFKKLMEVMKKFGEDAVRVNDAGFLANTYKYDVENVVKYQRGFSAASLDEGTFGQIAEFLAPLRDRENAEMTAAGRLGLGQREEALSVLASQGLADEVAALREAISGGTEQDMINAVLKLFTTANAPGSTITGRTVGAETGIGALSGLDSDRNAIIQDFLTRSIIINEDASLAMKTELEKFNNFFQDQMQKYMPLMVSVMEMINETLVKLDPILEGLVSSILGILDKFKDNPTMAKVKEEIVRFMDKSGAAQDSRSFDYFSYGEFDENKSVGYKAISNSLDMALAEVLPDSMLKLISKNIDPNDVNPTLSTRDKRMFWDLLSDNTGKNYGNFLKDIFIDESHYIKQARKDVAVLEKDGYQITITDMQANQVADR